MRRIAFLTGSRGEWGYIRPIIRIIENDPNMDYQIIATNMHMLPQFGNTVNEIESDGFHVSEKLYMTFDGLHLRDHDKIPGQLAFGIANHHCTA